MKPETVPPTACLDAMMEASVRLARAVLLGSCYITRLDISDIRDNGVDRGQLATRTADTHQLGRYLITLSAISKDPPRK